MLSAPTSTAPAARSRATAVASRVAGGWAALIFDPASVASPATSKRFLAANGTPASGPGSSPAARRPSMVSASARARSPSTAVKALSARSRRAIRSSAPATTSRARVLPARTDAAIDSADVVASIMDRSVAPARSSPAARTRRGAAPRPGARRGAAPRPRATRARCGARSAPPGARRRPRSRERARSRRRPRGDVGAPAAERRDLALPLAQDRLAEDAERLVAIREADLADAEAGRLGEQQRGESRRRHAPHLERDRGAAVADAQHRRVAVADRPQPILGDGRGVAQEARADGGEVAVELETTHQRAVHGQRDVHALSFDGDARRTDNPFAPSPQPGAAHPALLTRWARAPALLIRGAARRPASARRSARRCGDAVSSRVRHAPCSLHERRATLPSRPRSPTPGTNRDQGARMHKIEAERDAILERAVERSIEHAVFGGELGRRAFVARVGAATAAAALASVFPLGAARALAQDKPGPPEKKDLKVGFIPITCATPIIMAEPMGFYRKHGLNVQVTKASSWAMIRDLSINGETDATHMLSPMPLAISLGVGSQSVPYVMPAVENINGQAITLATRHKAVKSPAEMKGFK